MTQSLYIDGSVNIVAPEFRMDCAFYHSAQRTKMFMNEKSYRVRSVGK